MEPQDINWPVAFQKATIRTSDGSTFTGKINTREFKRLSDMLQNKDTRFIVLSGVQGSGNEEKTLIINSSSILWVEIVE